MFDYRCYGSVKTKCIDRRPEHRGTGCLYLRVLRFVLHGNIAKYLYDHCITKITRSKTTSSSTTARLRQVHLRNVYIYSIKTRTDKYPNIMCTTTIAEDPGSKNVKYL